MDAIRTKKAYAAPIVAAHGSITVKTKDDKVFPPIEANGSGTEDAAR